MAYRSIAVRYGRVGYTKTDNYDGEKNSCGYQHTNDLLMVQRKAAEVRIKVHVIAIRF